MKICSSCGEPKADSEFIRRCGRCKHCLYLENLAWREKNKDKVSKFNASRYKTNHSVTINKISKIPVKEKPIKEIKVKIIKPERPKSKKVTMVRVHSTENRSVKLVNNHWEKQLLEIKNRVKVWEDQQ
jgi:PP-loop superfamily ATP-utilizing enzyme